MPAGFTREQIGAIAALANLELKADEADLFAKQLGEILAYAEVIQQIDTTGIEPTASVVARAAADRRDAVVPSLDRDEVLDAAPDAAVDAGFFRVPRIIG